ncbi:hypothetical protein [Paraburkholderia sp. J11-2]|uniref:hypothetical protein n=1 Tax=Paraburkholderia sp. J11-2 TaxID=2805431 RepID=UPI002AB6C061|nr:hypothetical protein [Paraburkholderia sp. J11-2]
MSDPENDLERLVRLADGYARMVEMPGGPEKAVAHGELTGELKGMFDDPVFAPLSPKQKKDLFRALVGIIQETGGLAARAIKRSEEDQRECQRLTMLCDELRAEIDRLRGELQLRRDAIPPDPDQVAIDGDVIAYAGLFEKALRSGEETFIVVGVSAKAVWRRTRQDAHELLCTESERYATLRRLARASSSLAALALSQGILTHFPAIPAKFADAISRLFLSVCDGGREIWCKRYEASELISPDELARMKEISERPRDAGAGA